MPTHFSRLNVFRSGNTISSLVAARVSCSSNYALPAEEQTMQSAYQCFPEFSEQEVLSGAKSGTSLEEQKYFPSGALPSPSVR